MQAFFWHFLHAKACLCMSNLSGGNRTLVSQREPGSWGFGVTDAGMGRSSRFVSWLFLSYLPRLGSVVDQLDFQLQLNSSIQGWFQDWQGVATHCTATGRRMLISLCLLNTSNSLYADSTTKTFRRSRDAKATTNMIIIPFRRGWWTS